jgi:hypothetical protein
MYSKEPDMDDQDQKVTQHIPINSEYNAGQRKR